MPDSGQEQRHGAIPRTVASFFSGGGGGTTGLIRAGWTPVSYSEIDAFCNAILATHWPEVPNVGDITTVDPSDIPDATLWMGGFPCQDLSLAGPRRGLRHDDGSLTRSGLAFTFLDLVEARRPRAFLLENVSGLLSSSHGLDLLALQDQVGELGYSCAWRVLDSQYAGVPQRRRRVFLLALDLERHPDEFLPGEVLGVTSTCTRDHQQEREAWEAAAPAPAGSVDLYNSTAAFGQWKQGDIAGALSRRDYKSTNHILVGTSPDTNGGGAPVRMARWVHDPEGMDSQRYQVIGNGAVAPVIEWIGRRLSEAL